MTQSKPLVFFGSGPVGAATLAGLTGFGFKFEAIITKPRPAHHKSSMPVLDWAISHNISVFTPIDKAELSDVFRTTSFKSGLGIVVDYGIIIAKSVIDSFELGIINSHFSLLPQWRGADPITFAILSGQETTGVSLMLIDESLDTGNLLAQEKLTISERDIAPDLTKRLISLSNQLLMETIPRYLAGDVKPSPQDTDIEPTYSRQLTKSDGQVDWCKPAEIIEREVRAYLGWPKSSAKIFGRQVVITKSRVAEGEADGTLVIKCTPGWLEIQELIAPSGRTMSGADFIRGYKRLATGY
jgi:methionyl-tRNA formyltransferase